MWFKNKKSRFAAERKLEAANIRAERAEAQAARLCGLLVGRVAQAAGGNEKLAEALRALASFSTEDPDQKGVSDYDIYEGYARGVAVARALIEDLPIGGEPKFAPMDGVAALVDKLSEFVDGVHQDASTGDRPYVGPGRHRGDLAEIVVKFSNKEE